MAVCENNIIVFDSPDGGVIATYIMDIVIFLYFLAVYSTATVIDCPPSSSHLPPGGRKQKI